MKIDYLAEWRMRDDGRFVDLKPRLLTNDIQRQVDTIRLSLVNERSE